MVECGSVIGEAEMRLESIFVCGILLWSASEASAQQRDEVFARENFFRVSGPNVSSDQAFERGDTYFRVLVHDTNIYTRRDRGGKWRKLLDWFNSNAEKRAVANLRLVLGSGDHKKVSGTNFQEIYDEFSGDSRKARYKLRESISAGGLELLPNTIVPDSMSPPLKVGFYGLVEDRHESGGLSATLNSLLPIATSPKIGSAVSVIDQAIAAYENITTYLYHNTGYGRLFAGGATDDAFANGGVLEQPGYWVLSSDLAQDSPSSYTVRCQDGFCRLFHAPENGDGAKQVVDQTYALIEFRKVPSRIAGKNADYGRLDAVVEKYNSAVAAAVQASDSVKERKDVARDFYDWLVDNAALELTVKDMSALSLRVAVTAIEIECRGLIFVSASECSAERLGSLQKPRVLDSSEDDVDLSGVEEQQIYAQDLLDRLSLKETLLEDIGFITGHEHWRDQSAEAGTVAKEILDASPSQLYQLNQTIGENSIRGQDLDRLRLPEEERIELIRNELESALPIERGELEEFDPNSELQGLDAESLEQLERIGRER